MMQAKFEQGCLNSTLHTLQLNPLKILKGQGRIPPNQNDRLPAWARWPSNHEVRGADLQALREWAITWRMTA
jgi:hypothetical protein